MAWKRCDDYDGSTEDVQPVPFGYEGTIYLAHMGPDSRKKFEEAMAPWIEDQVAHRPMPTITDGEPEPSRPRASATKTPPSQGRKRPPTRPDVAEIRAWAATQGREVGAAGRLSNELIAEYDARPV